MDGGDLSTHQRKAAPISLLHCETEYTYFPRCNHRHRALQYFNMIHNSLSLLRPSSLPSFIIHCTTCNPLANIILYLSSTRFLLACHIHRWFGMRSMRWWRSRMINGINTGQVVIILIIWNMIHQMHPTRKTSTHGWVAMNPLRNNYLGRDIQQSRATWWSSW